MDGSNGKIVELLERIALGQEQTNERLDHVHGEVKQTNARLGGLEREVKQTNVRLGSLEREVKQTNARLDNVIGFLGQHYADHEARIKALEERVFKSG